MQTTRVFTSGNSQAVRIPKEFQMDESELFIQKIGSTILLFPKKRPWEAFERSLGEFSDDFMEDGRAEPKGQERKGL